MKSTLLSLCFVLTSASFSISQIPDGYYTSAERLTGNDLKAALYTTIKDHTSITYAQLWTAFQTTDVKSNGYVWDMYSDIPGGTPSYEFTFITDQCGNYSSEGDCYNREHSFPKSWFGGEVAPMYTDLFHIYPTDGYVNNQRGNLPLGEVNSPSWTSTNGSKVGVCSYSGYTGSVFEPLDSFKGDFARSYFYMVTRYHNLVSTWSCDMLDGTTYPAFATWAMNMLLEWNKLDPVSSKEVNRNNVVYNSFQHNRNPFIDHPGYAELIWSDDGLDSVKFTSTPTESIFVNETYAYSITVAWEAGTSLNLSCTELPAWLTFTNNGDGTASLSGIPTEVGNYTVTLVASDDFTSAEQSFTISVTYATTITRVQQSSVLVYPNPVNDIITVEVSGFKADRVAVVNLIGIMVLSKSFNDEKTTLDLKGLATGIYFVKIIGSNQQKIVRIIHQ